MTKYIAVSGNPVDGFTFWGPFNSPELANEWAETELRRETWWVAELQLVGDAVTQ